nr:PREDICTED: long-chain-fatty-acid--CoA ligase ACSBG2-like [Paralichthys olivaceus]
MSCFSLISGKFKMSIQEDSVLSNGVAVGDGDTESIPSQTDQTVSDLTDLKTYSTVILNGEATTAELRATSTSEDQETEAPVKPPRSPELEEKTEGLPPEEPKAVPLSSGIATLAPADQLWSVSRNEAVQLRMEGSGQASETPITIHQMFLETVEHYGDYSALMSKEEGQWVTLTWRQYYEQCRAAAKSFLKLGLERYHGVGILGFNSPEWFISDIGCILAGHLTWTARTASTLVDFTYGVEVLVSYLPLSHVAAQMIDMWLTMVFAGTVYFADPDALKGSLGTTLKEARPTYFMGVPRVWEKMQEKMRAIGAKASPMRKRVADWAKSIGLQYSYSAMNGENVVPWGFMLANNLVFKKVRAALGLDRCKICFTGAAPITKDTLEYFMSLNMPLMELYGMSESSGPHTVSINDSYRISSCGKVMPGCKTKLENPDADGNGEICFWGRNVFMGYLNMADKTTEALDDDGWLHSGDLGKNDQYEFLYITGRIKELIITAGGENIPPVPIEDALKAEVPIISNSMLIGDKLKFLSMLLTLKCVVDDNGDPTDELSPEVLDFCQQQGVTATKVSEIIANKEPAVYKAIQEGVERINAKATSNAMKVQKWVIAETDFSIVGGELGPTMKLRRPIVVKKYQEKINEMYAVNKP